MEVLRLKRYTVRVTEIWSHKNVWKQCPLDPLFSQPYYPIENWSSANSHCVSLSRRINALKLISGLWSGPAELEFTHGTILFTSGGNLQTCKTEISPPQPVSQTQEFHLSHNLVGAQFSCLQREKKCSCDNVKQCVLTIQLNTVGMSCRKSSQLEDLLMYCDSCCQQFSSALSSCNFQPSPLHWYRFKSLLTITHTEAVGAINRLLWFWCFTLYESKERCFQNTCVDQLN